MNSSEASEVAWTGKLPLPEEAVAELSVEKTASGSTWSITSWDRRIDQAIADVLPVQQRSSDSASGGLVRDLLADEVLIRIADGGAVRIDEAAIGKRADERCPCREGGGAELDGLLRCLCGCHFGGICRRAIARYGRGEAPQAEFLFTLHDEPDLGLILMRSTSWATSLWLRDLSRSRALKSGALEVRLRLLRSRLRTRSGIEVTLTQPVGQPLLRGMSIGSYRLSA